jgi:hypothetical protein
MTKLHPSLTHLQCSINGNTRFLNLKNLRSLEILVPDEETLRGFLEVLPSLSATLERVSLGQLAAANPVLSHCDFHKLQGK